MHTIYCVMTESSTIAQEEFTLAFMKYTKCWYIEHRTGLCRTTYLVNFSANCNGMGGEHVYSRRNDYVWLSQVFVLLTK